MTEKIGQLNNIFVFFQEHFSEKMSEGSKHISTLGEASEEVLSRMGSVKSLVDQTVSATISLKEKSLTQESKAREVGLSMNNVNVLFSESARHVEEIASAVDSLAKGTVDLNNLLNSFKV